MPLLSRCVGLGTNLEACRKDLEAMLEDWMQVLLKCFHKQNKSRSQWRDIIYTQAALLLQSA